MVLYGWTDQYELDIIKANDCIRGKSTDYFKIKRPVYIIYIKLWISKFKS